MSDEHLVICPLCGHRFPERPSCPSGCPLARRCRSLCCPNCRYRFVVASTTSRWLERLLGRRVS